MEGEVVVLVETDANPAGFPAAEVTAVGVFSFGFADPVDDGFAAVPVTVVGGAFVGLLDGWGAVAFSNDGDAAFDADDGDE